MLCWEIVERDKRLSFFLYAFDAQTVTRWRKFKFKTTGGPPPDMRRVPDRRSRLVSTQRAAFPRPGRVGGVAASAGRGPGAGGRRPLPHLWP